MIRNSILLAILALVFSSSRAQLCPGGGTNFSNAVLFDPAWIAGCSSGTSCAGGTTFDNRASCEPATAIDACAPAPTCASSANAGSDLWFKFYATSTTASISLIQSVSFIATIQAFSSTGTTCASLTQIGCSIAGGPSSGVTLNLSGLTKNTLYYFRVFGTSTTPSQRTGTFCFCGTAGVSNIVLPLKLLSFTGKIANGATFLKWVATEQNAVSHFEIQKSVDGVFFTTVGRKNTFAFTAETHEYSFVDNTAGERLNYYRLKIVDENGSFEYSSIIKIFALASTEGFATFYDRNNPSAAHTGARER